MAARKNFSTGQIINALRKAEVGIANGKAIKDVCRELGVSEQTYYRWRREYGGMKASDRPPIVVPPTVLVQRPPEAWGEGR